MSSGSNQSGSGDTSTAGDAPLRWAIIAAPDAHAAWPVAEPGDNTRVLLPADARFDPLDEKLSADDVPVRRVRYLIDQELIEGTDRDLRATGATSPLVPPARPTRRRGGQAARAARSAFDVLWHAHEPRNGTPATPVPAADVLPADWLRFLPFHALNPAQARAVPEILGSDRHLVVVAATGAGKTVIGMLAALRAVLEQGGKAAWLVPQRSLTDELNRELDVWRREGLRVERLSGEYSVDADRIAAADMWVATTEKFEALCRTSTLRAALGEVSCLIVDEIHLLGDPGRGPILEALLARMRDNTSRVRVIGLSATVSNAAQLADWMAARLVRTGWRPNRQTWQLPTIPTHADWGLSEAARTRLVTAITAMVTDDGGTVLVFCGSKRIVRQTALILASHRGANIHRIRPDDSDRLHEVCQSAGIGLHYQGWEYRHQAERDFRQRRLRVLVATPTLAAGVNLPARAVIIRDTQVGLNRIDVGTVQQMFGRAGRVGTGEGDGYAFLIVDESERADWQARLVAGYTVESQILSSLADHVLAEAVQGRIGSLAEAESWWVRTLAHHQGRRSLVPLRKSVDFLVEAGFLTAGAGEDRETTLSPTELGLLTARIMVSVTAADRLRRGLAQLPLPSGPAQAEEALIAVVSTAVPKLAQAVLAEDLKPLVARLIAEHGHGADTRGGRSDEGALARAALLVASTDPELFTRSASDRDIDGLPYSRVYPMLEEAPRYLFWVGCQGLLGTVHPWCAIVAADLGRRITWRRCAPRRGAGRLLWMCEQMATSVHADELVPELWRAATACGLVDPDWPATRPPNGCRLGPAEYAELLRDRATGCTLEHIGTDIVAGGPPGGVLAVWHGTQYRTVPLRRGAASLPAPLAGVESVGAAVFTWRGDYRATGWLRAYSQVTPD